jgi:hypothetical protein
MSSLNADFNELLERISRGRELSHASFEPIYYLVFRPRQILEVKRSMAGWLARLKNDGWKVTVFSIAEQVLDIHQSAKVRKIWLAADRVDPLAWEKTNKSLANALTTGDALQKRLEGALDQLEGQEDAMLIVSDLEALHPYLKIGQIEGQLQGKFSVPTIFLYPGQRAGKTKLRFLGFYSADGNYRSVHVGG